VKFAKLHGLGNDFLIAESDARSSLPELAQRICDRHCGVGADGIIFFYQPAASDPDAECSALIFNADGSQAEMSGNGVRCLAAFLHYSGRCSADAIGIRTVAGIKRLELKQRDRNVFVFRCSMGQPILDPARIPAKLTGPGPVLEHTLETPAGAVNVTLSSMGNPHCSIFWPDLDRAPIDQAGPALEHHPCFPNRTNVEFIQVLDAHHLRVAFWERGVGPTKASGTGSSAAAVAAVLNGLAETPIAIRTELGELNVEWSPGRELFLTGPAEFICAGDYFVTGLPAERS